MWEFKKPEKKDKVQIFILREELDYGGYELSIPEHKCINGVLGLVGIYLKPKDSTNKGCCRVKILEK